MKSVLVYAVWLSVIFVVLRFILGFKNDGREIKEKRKELLVDACIVFVSCFICDFLIKKFGFHGIQSGPLLGNKTTLVFTDNAGF